ncbi:hypothetical protein [Microbacterium hydrocarbonoxydans]|uniref:hypothetical protein n=1 Tax=Microbacterium hydrocarbonoxydans TaxID=273678 RepID=UPI00204170CF|nr:hypothetical protein [Microbacterium hydrocarbonoxydans]MCM3779870.1 hypothetical protein [Microbacterium hydrocarbonoxydans]
MTHKHKSPEWSRTTRTIRSQVRAAYERGEVVGCWRCGAPLPIDAEGKVVFDVGHLDPNGGESIDNAAPEHRSKSGQCVGNRAHGGRMGAAITNARRSTKSTFKALPWA